MNSSFVSKLNITGYIILTRMGLNKQKISHFKVDLKSQTEMIYAFIKN